MTNVFVDIHCHLLPGIDDGAKDLDETLAMARLTVADGTSTVIATPHQLGNYASNRGDEIRRSVGELRRQLAARGIPLKVLPGADVRIEPGMSEGLASGEVLSLGDHRKHALLELPHELYLPLERVLSDLARRNMVGVLSHPERNEGIQRKPEIVGPLVEAGCLMQITAGSLCGSFGPDCQQLAESLLADGLVHFVATDAHGPRSRRPLMRRAYERVVELTDEATAVALCCENPALVAAGEDIPGGRRAQAKARRSWWTRRAVTS
jgi:protein-tyrosine phosphatase